MSPSFSNIPDPELHEKPLREELSNDPTAPVPDDGYIIRAGHQWTLDKLEVLDLYYPAFTKATKRAPARHLFEGFAGPGLNRIGSEILHGSPLIAMNTSPPFTTGTFMDLDPSNIDALQHRLGAFGGRAVATVGDCNVDLVPEIAGRVGPWDPSLCVLDPEGADVAWSTPKAIAAIPKRSYKIEQLILFPTNTGFLRLLPLESELKDWARERITRMYGHEEWLDIYKARRRQLISSDRATTEYVKLYAEGFTRLGYRSVLDKEIRDGGHRGRLRYFLIFATDHPLGETIMNRVFNKAGTERMKSYEQPTLFDFKPERRKRLDE